MTIQVSNFAVLVAGLLLIMGASNKRIVALTRRVGRSLAFLQHGSFGMSRLSEKDRDRIARLWLIWLGGFLVLGSVIAVVT
jgi:hypothetical protein